MKVVAVEANPELVSFGRERFCREIEGGDLVLHHGAVVGRPQSSAIRLYVNHRDSGSSSVHENWRAGDEHYIVEAPPTTIAELIKNHGMPSYIKIDIEGADEDVISNLPSEFAPAYLSCEMSFSGEVLDLLVDLGYTEFKLINQATFTQSTEILDPEIAMRALRKAGTLFPRFEDVVRNLPDYLRPSRIM
jgi:FkbM family methyltransferase